MGKPESTNEHRTRPSTTMTWLSGVGVGVAATLLTLRVVGVPLQPGLDSSAFRKFISAYQALYQGYFTPLSQAKLLNGAVLGMTQATGDPFTEYFPPAAETQFQRILTGTFSGIGVVLKGTNAPFIIDSVNPGSPAERAGIRARDMILAVNHESVQGETLDELSRKVQGPTGTKVVLTIRRPSVPGKTLDITVTRGIVQAPTVSVQVRPDGLGYMRISIIGAHTANEVQAAMNRLEKAKVKGVIVDLRGNGGGYLDQVIDIASQFVAKGKVILETQNRGENPQPILSKGPGTSLKVVVLMDGYTASAAEVLSAALHDDLRAPLVGTRSYGKGTMQETETYPDGSGMKYTVGRWLTPTGQWIHHKGLQPTVRVNLPAYVNLPYLDTSKLPLRFNMNNSQVGVLQQTLSALGYPVGRKDGFFDESTKEAVMRYQTKSGMQPTGIVNQTMAARLATDLNNLIAAHDVQLDAAVKTLKSLLGTT